jgi:hypothetical protein
MQNPALPETFRPAAETKVSKRHPRAEWSIQERSAWEDGMTDAIGIAQALGASALAGRLEEALVAGPF